MRRSFGVLHDVLPSYAHLRRSTTLRVRAQLPIGVFWLVRVPRSRARV